MQLRVGQTVGSGIQGTITAVAPAAGWGNVDVPRVFGSTYGDQEGENYVVLCRIQRASNTGRWVTWIINPRTKECCFGRYKDTYSEAVQDFAERTQS